MACALLLVDARPAHAGAKTLPGCWTDVSATTVFCFTGNGRLAVLNTKKQTRNFGRWKVVGGRHLLRYSPEGTLYRDSSVSLNLTFHSDHFKSGRHRYNRISVDDLDKTVAKAINKLLVKANGFKVSLGPEQAKPLTAAAKDPLVGCHSRFSKKSFGKRQQTVCFRRDGRFAITLANGKWNHGEYSYVRTDRSKGRLYRLTYGKKGTFIPGKVVPIWALAGDSGFRLGGKQTYTRVSSQYAYQSRPQLRLPNEKLAQALEQVRPKRTSWDTNPYRGCWFETKRAGKRLSVADRGMVCFTHKSFWKLSAAAIANPPQRLKPVSPASVVRRIRKTGPHSIWLDGSDYELGYQLNTTLPEALFLVAEKRGKKWKTVGDYKSTPLRLKASQSIGLVNVEAKGRRGGAVAYWSTVDELVIHFAANSPVLPGQTVRIHRETVPERPRWMIVGTVDKPGKGLPKHVHLSSWQVKNAGNATPTDVAVPTPKARTSPRDTARVNRNTQSSAKVTKKVVEKGPQFKGSYTIKNDSSHKLYVWMGSGSGWLNKGSTKSASCAKRSKVYWSKTNRSSDKKLAFEATPQHCGKTTRIGRFVR